jgi:hypothetical protein
MNKIPMLEKFAAQSLVEHDGELIFSKEKFAELIVQECCSKLEEMGEGWHEFAKNPPDGQAHNASGALFAAYRLKEDAVDEIKQHFGVEE